MRVGGVGFWARVWVLNEETFKLERELQSCRRNERAVNRYFFQRYLAFSSEGHKKICLNHPQDIAWDVLD